MKKQHVELSPAALMKAIDSPAGSDPMPVEHHEFPKRYPELIDAGVTEFMSVVYSKTIRKGHRSPVCVDGAGKLFTIEHMAEDRGWSLDWAQRVFNRAIDRGLVRRGKGGKNDYSPAGIVLCGRVKPFINNVVEDTNELVGSECTLRKLRSLLSESEYAQFEKLDEETRAQFLEVELAGEEGDKQIWRDTMWAARQIISNRQHTRRRRFGIEPDAPAKKRRNEESIVQLALVSDATIEERSDHSAVSAGANTPSNGTEHSAVSLFTSPSVFYPSINKRGRQAGSEAVVEEPEASQPATPPPSRSEKNGHKPKAPDDLVIALVNRGFPHADFDTIRKALTSVPLEFFFVKILDPRLERAKRARESIGPGLLVELAKDAVRAYGNEAATRAAGY